MNPMLMPSENRKLSKAATLQGQQKCFLRANKAQENATVASYEVAQLLAEHRKAFTDGDFIKQCLKKVAGIMCPENLHDFNNVSLSRNTVERRIEDLSANVKHQVSHTACAFDFYLLHVMKAQIPQTPHSD